MGFFNRHKQTQKTLEIERLNREVEQLKEENKAYQQFVEQTYYYAGSYPAIKLISEFGYLSPNFEHKLGRAEDKHNLIQQYMYRYLTAYLTLLKIIAPPRADHWERIYGSFIKEIKDNIDKHPTYPPEQFNDFK